MLAIHINYMPASPGLKRNLSRGAADCDCGEQDDRAGGGELEAEGQDGHPGDRRGAGSPGRAVLLPQDDADIQARFPDFALKRS